MKTKYKFHVILFLVSTMNLGCTYYENEPPPKPFVPKASLTLEAAYTSLNPTTINSPFWNTVNFYEVTSTSITTGSISAEDGIFNSSGTLNGTTSFNGGEDPGLTLKAGYDDSFIYILASWKDKTFNASNNSWFFNGHPDPNKPGATDGWTSQQNDDNIIFEFPISGSESDIWKWSLSLSEPLGYALDMYKDAGGTDYDAGDRIFVRNAVDPLDFRSGPVYDWDGMDNQTLERNPGPVATILDPAYYLLNTKSIVGDAELGDAAFLSACAVCHGNEAEGEEGPPLNARGKFMRLSFAAFQSNVSRGSHDGSSYYSSLTEEERINLYARLKGFSGVPGYILQNPTGSNSDISAISNVQLALIDEKTENTGYSVLLIRPLSTGNTDDIVFNPLNTPYTFHVFLSDNDDLNKIGEMNIELTFKPKN